jgi:hypothetical protein
VLDCACDIGLPSSQLRTRYPELDWALACGRDGREPLAEHWWHRGEVRRLGASLGAIVRALRSSRRHTCTCGIARHGMAWQANPVGGRARWEGRQLSLIRKLLGGDFCPIIAEGSGGVRERVRALKIFLEERAERVVVVVGHSAFFQHFVKTYGDGSFKRKLRNCEVLRCADAGIFFSEPPLPRVAEPHVEMRELSGRRETNGVSTHVPPSMSYRRFDLAYS